jgi:hypothetical protein
MVTSSRQFQTLEDLRDYVNEILCQCDQLETDAFPLTQRLLRRGGEPCGIHFCLHGPRQVQFSAIWDATRNSLLFYGPSGERFRKIDIIAAPPMEEVVG